MPHASLLYVGLLTLLHIRTVAVGPSSLAMQGRVLLPQFIKDYRDPRERQALSSHFYSPLTIHYSLPPVFHTFPQPYQSPYSSPNSLKSLDFPYTDSNPPSPVRMTMQ